MVGSLTSPLHYIHTYILHHHNFRKRKILLWCCGPQTDAYEARKSAMITCAHSQRVSLLTEQHVPIVNMAPHRPSHGFSDRQSSILPLHTNPSVNSIMANHRAAIALGEEDLTSELQYHVKLLILLSSCNLGPKLQAVYPTNDILYALLDPSTILPVKLALGKLLIEALRINPDKVEKLVRICVNYILQLLLLVVKYCLHSCGSLCSGTYWRRSLVHSSPYHSNWSRDSQTPPPWRTRPNSVSTKVCMYVCLSTYLLVCLSLCISHFRGHNLVVMYIH